jgi:hypothetical protein
MIRRFSTLVAVLALGVFGAFNAAGAILLNVTNASFENLPGTGLMGCGVGCVYTQQVVPGWTFTGVPTPVGGQFQPGVQAGDFAFFNSLSDGAVQGYVNNGAGLTQTITDVVELGCTYTLLVDIGLRKDAGAFLATADLLINGVKYAATGTTPVAGGWSTFTANYVGLAQDAGKPITIELYSVGSNSQGNFDNVRLSYVAVAAATPEPASIIGLGLGLLAIGGLSRRWTR